MKTCLLSLTISLATCSLGVGMTNSDVIRMVQKRSDISIYEIIDKINRSHDGFDLLPEEVRHLRNRHVPQSVIAAMFARNSNQTTPVPGRYATQGRDATQGKDATPGSYAPAGPYPTPGNYAPPGSYAPTGPYPTQVRDAPPWSYATPPLPPRKRVGQSLILKESTPVRLRLIENLSSSSDLRFGDRVEFEVLEDVLVGAPDAAPGRRGFLVIPRNAPAWGTVTKVNPTKLLGHYGTVEVALDAVKLANGDKVALIGTERGDRHIRPGLIVLLLAPIGYVIQPKDPVWLTAFNSPDGRPSVLKDGRDFKVMTDGVADLDSAEFETR